MPYPTVDLSQVHTYPLGVRPSLMELDHLKSPGGLPPAFDNPELLEVAERIVKARQAGAPVIWMMGAHVIKRGLAPYLIDLLQRGVITHLAGNGAVAIHDFEIAMQGHTTEDVATQLSDGSFGMADETGRLMNLAVQQGARRGLGMGEALGAWIADDTSFQYRQHSVLYNAWRLGVPFTLHIAIGTDIIHQHPQVDFAAIGWASGQDFKVFTHAVCGLEGGVFLNFGSSVIGPEVFLKAISIARNLGNPVRVFTTANFDLQPLEGDYRRKIGDDIPEYYYRPRKNIVNRPVLLGGKGFHICADHLVSIPNLSYAVCQAIGETRFPQPGLLPEPAPLPERLENRLAQSLETNPELEPAADELRQAFRLIDRCWRTGGTVFLAAAGWAQDTIFPLRYRAALEFVEHIWEPAADRASSSWPLPGRMRLVALGANLDFPGLNPDWQMAQELYYRGRDGDLLLCASRELAPGAWESTRVVAFGRRLQVISLASQKMESPVQPGEIGILLPDSIQQSALETLLNLVVNE